MKLRPSKFNSVLMNGTFSAKHKVYRRTGNCTARELRSKKEAVFYPNDTVFVKVPEVRV